MLEKRELERKILGGIDRLVHILIDISSAAGRPKAVLMEQAAQMVRDLSPLLLNLLGGQEEHLEGLLRQLVSQKLPPRLALISFGSLQEDLDRILAVAFFKESEEPAPLHLTEQEQDTTIQEPMPSEDQEKEEEPEQVERQEVEENSPRDESLPDLTPFIKGLFPQATILPGCYYRSVFLDYYLPEEKFALCIMQPGRRIIPSLEKLIKKEGLTLIKVEASEINNPQILTRLLKSR